MGFPGDSDGEEFTCNVVDLGLIPGLARSPGGGHGNPPQHACIKNPHGQSNLTDYIQFMGLQSLIRLGIPHSWFTVLLLSDMLHCDSVFL